MCIICASPRGAKQPSKQTLMNMFYNNPHGAGYMYSRNGKVIIHKGYMRFEDYLEALEFERFTPEDSVVYHFRISTQAGIGPEMTHPFPLSNRLDHMKALDLSCQVGVAHNGIIRLTADPDNWEYSDTALFIAKYMSRLIRRPADLRSKAKLDLIYELAKSKLAILDGTGYIATVGDFIEERGNLYSNTSFKRMLW